MKLSQAHLQEKEIRVIEAKRGQAERTKNATARLRKARQDLRDVKAGKVVSI